MTIRIDKTNSQKKIVENIDLFKLLPIVIEPYETLLAQCLLNYYIVWYGIENDKIIGLALFKITQFNAHIAGVVAVNQTFNFRDLFYEELKKINVKTITANSKLPEESYTRLMKMDKKLYSVYQKTL